MQSLKHEFVEFIPEALEEGILYISISYATVAHKCCCGCGREVVTPLTPTDWSLVFDGETVSLNPSVGNWSFPCRSHYWIKQNFVRWADQWSDEQVRLGRANDSARKERHYGRRDAPPPKSIAQRAEPGTVATNRPSIWRRVRRFLGWK